MKKVISVALSLSLMLSITLPTFAVDSAKDFSLDVKDLDEEIQLLLDERAAILSNSFLENDNMDLRLTDLEAIDSKLCECGVEFLSDEQAKNMLLQMQNNTSSENGGQVYGIDRVEPPDTGVNVWMTYRSTYTSNGVSYNIQRLVAQPKRPNSPLKDSGNRTLNYTVNWAAGAENLISSVSESVAGEIIPGASIVLSIYDAVRSFISGLSSTTEVSAPEIVYTWATTITATFIYVRLETESDSAQWLSSISTKTETSVSYSIPNFCTEADGSLHPKVVQGERMIYSTPSRYANIADAVDAYNGVYPCPILNEVYNIRISGPENKNVEVIYPCNPNSPLDCEW